MEQEEKSATLPAAVSAGEELEFRPWVKWCGLGAAGFLSVGFFLVTYYVGYSQGREAGFTEATGSGMVQKALNEAASRNVLNFMRLASASEEELLRAAVDTEAAFGWIKDDSVRLEAEWCLVEALLERNKAEASLQVLTPLFEQVPHSVEWGYRALQAGNLLAAEQQYEAAERLFRLAAQVFTENKQENWCQEAFGQLVALAASAPQDTGKTLASLEKLLDELRHSDEGTRQLRAMARVHLAQLHSAAGNMEQANAEFRKALAESENLRTLRPEGAVSRGTALLALGETDAAESMLRIAESAPGNSLSDVSSRLLALRQLAVIEQQRGHHVTSLAMLNRAQGMAEGRVMPGNPFWPCLYDQRGWMHYIVQNYQTALLDFSAALAATQEEKLLIQPQEGAARCYLELGKGGEALPLLERCLALRQKHAPADSAAIGRLHLLLGQIYDQQGKVAEAEAAYAEALSRLPADAPAGVENRLAALLGRAYALTDMQRWAEAYHTWKEVLPLLNDQPDRREEVRVQMRRIKPLLPAEIPAAEPTPAQS